MGVFECEMLLGRRPPLSFVPKGSPLVARCLSQKIRIMAAVKLTAFIAELGKGIQVGVKDYEKNGRSGIYLWTSHQIEEFDRHTGQKISRRLILSIANSITREFVASKGPTFLHEAEVIPMKGGGYCVVHPELQGEAAPQNFIVSATF